MSYGKTPMCKDSDENENLRGERPVTPPRKPLLDTFYFVQALELEMYGA